jgi:hypothetical protein
MPRKRKSSTASNSAFQASSQKPIVELERPLALKGLPPATQQFTAKGLRQTGKRIPSLREIREASK